MDRSSHTDVLISHHPSDSEAAGALASMLRAKRVDAVCNDSSSDESTSAAAQHTKVFVAWMSSAYCLDPALQREFMHAFAACSRFAPRERVLLVDALNPRDGSLPSILRSSCEVVRPNEINEAVERVANQTRQRTQYISMAASERIHRDFVGRIGHLWQMHEALAQDSHGCVQLIGAAGGGKTWLADEYAQAFAAAYPGGVFRLDAGWFEQPRSSQLKVMRTEAMLKVVAQLGIAADSIDVENVEAQLKQLLDERSQPYLWIVDHMPAQQAADEVRAWFAPSSYGATVLITRSEQYAALSAQISVGGLDEDEARALLKRHKPMATDQEIAGGRHLIEQLGHHALALHLAGGRLARSTYDRMLLQLAAPAREAAQLADALAPVLQHPQLVGICVSLQRSIARLSSQARHALRLASVLAQAPVPTALLTTALAQQIRAASNNSVSQIQLAIDELLGFALAQRVDDDHLVITPLVREGVLGCESAAELDAARDLLAAIFAGELPQALEAERTNHYWSWIPHALQIARTANASSQLVEVNGWLARFGMLGPLCTGNRRAVILLEQGDLNNAQQLLDMELAARRKGLGQDHPNTVTPVNNLGVALSMRGDFSRARTMFEQAIAVRRKALGDNHTDLLTPLNNLGVVLWHEGEHVKARALFEKVVELRKGLLGDRHPETLVSMRNLAVALRHDGEYVAARSLLEHVVEVRRDSLGNQHVDTCTAMASLAETLREHSEAILSRISNTLSLDAPLLGHQPGVRVARA